MVWEEKLNRLKVKSIKLPAAKDISSAIWSKSAALIFSNCQRNPFCFAVALTLVTLSGPPAAQPECIILLGCWKVVSQVEAESYPERRRWRW